MASFVTPYFTGIVLKPSPERALFIYLKRRSQEIMRCAGALMIILTWIAVVAAAPPLHGALPSPTQPPTSTPPQTVSPTPTETPPSPSPTQSSTPMPPSATPTATPPQSDEEMRALVELMEHVAYRLKGVKSLECPVELKLNMQMGVLALPMDLGGVYTYIHPDMNRLKLTRIPKILSRYPHLFEWNNMNFVSYRYSILPDGQVNGIDCRVVRMDAIDPRNDIRQRDIWISKKDHTTPRQIFRYPDGDVTAEVKYRAEKRWLVFDRIQSCLSFPVFNLTAQIDAECGEYKVTEENPPADVKSAPQPEPP